MTQTTLPTLTQYVPEHLRVGSPDVVGPLAVFPLFGPAPQLDYQTPRRPTRPNYWPPSERSADHAPESPPRC